MLWRAASRSPSSRRPDARRTRTLDTPPERFVLSLRELAVALAMTDEGYVHSASRYTFYGRQLSRATSPSDLGTAYSAYSATLIFQLFTHFLCIFIVET